MPNDVVEIVFLFMSPHQRNLYNTFETLSFIMVSSLPLFKILRAYIANWFHGSHGKSWKKRENNEVPTEPQASRAPPTEPLLPRAYQIRQRRSQGATDIEATNTLNLTY